MRGKQFQTTVLFMYFIWQQIGEKRNNNDVRFEPDIFHYNNKTIRIKQWH